MSDPFIGQILLVGFNFAPVGWHICDGTLLPISQYAALFSLLGTSYGGNGTTNFALPDLRSRVPIGIGQGVGLSTYVIGQQAGVENVTLLANQMPAHNHNINATASGGGVASPANAFLAETADPRSVYNTYSASQSSPATLNPGSLSTSGGNQPHTNIQPVLAMNYIIALQGIFPSRG